MKKEMPLPYPHLKDSKKDNTQKDLPQAKTFQI